MYFKLIKLFKIKETLMVTDIKIKHNFERNGKYTMYKIEYLQFLFI